VSEKSARRCGHSEVGVFRKGKTGSSGPALEETRWNPPIQGVQVHTKMSQRAKTEIPVYRTRFDVFGVGNGVENESKSKSLDSTMSGDIPRQHHAKENAL
jgi:hypothetical protein